jgi:hypothetical protein
LVNQFTSAPDLIIGDLFVANNGVTVVIGNVGNAPVTTPFWVDVYFDPEPVPPTVNQTWQMLGDEGLVWGVDITLLPGESLTLTIGDAFFNLEASNFSGLIGAGTAVYAQADSANAGVDYGAVLEIHEITGAPYNNISGPVIATEAVVVTWEPGAGHCGCPSAFPAGQGYRV